MLFRSGAKRLADFPDLPTMEEAGYGGFASGNWQGLFARRGTADDVVQRLFQTVSRAMASETARAEFGKALAAITVSGSPAQFAEQLMAERGRWVKGIEQAGLSFD